MRVPNSERETACCFFHIVIHAWLSASWASGGFPTMKMHSSRELIHFCLSCSLWLWSNKQRCGVFNANRTALMERIDVSVMNHPGCTVVPIATENWTWNDLFLSWIILNPEKAQQSSMCIRLSTTSTTLSLLISNSLLASLASLGSSFCVFFASRALFVALEEFRHSSRVFQEHAMDWVTASYISESTVEREKLHPWQVQIIHGAVKILWMSCSKNALIRLSVFFEQSWKTTCA